MGNNFYYIKYISLAVVGFLIATAKAKAQQTYHNYDGTTRGVEYHIARSQIDSNNQMVKYLNNQKEKLSILDSNGSITRSRIQGVISSKENENFRLNQKSYMLIETSGIKRK
jgi:hypothetical protein